MKVLVVLPAYNEATVIKKVLSSLPKRIEGAQAIEYVVVDDGSTDSTAKITKSQKIKVLPHVINRGLGAAIKTGIEYARIKKADVLVTFDSDGQHHPSDIKKVIAPILQKKAHLVIGSRFKKNQHAPVDRLVINWLANIATLIFFGVFSSDSQSGLRAFSKEAYSAINYKADKMDFSSEILLEAKRNKLKIAEVPISLIYTKYSRAKGQKNLNSLSVFAKFLVRLFR